MVALDRQRKTLLQGERVAVQQALSTGHPAPDAAAWPGLAAGEPLPALTEHALQAFLEGFRDVQVPITPEEIHQQLAAHARLLEALITWLNTQTG